MEENKEQESEEKITEKKELTKPKESFTDKVRANPWMLSTFVLGILTFIFLVTYSGGMTGNVISEDDAGEALLNFANVQGAGAELVSVKNAGDFYEVILLMEGREVPLMVTKDGENMVQFIPLGDIQETQQQETPEPVGEYSEDDLEKLKEFSSCLAKKGLKIYGANWCGWTKKLVVETLGGFEVAGESYIECTEEKELCASEEVTGYPTIKLNGEPYSGERTLDALGKETGCSIPELSVQQISSTEDANCS